MTPIEKNIIVLDEQGNEYEATYPKRANGLVKNGRARFVGENKICLVCPPTEIDTEDIKMSETNIKNNEVEAKDSITVERIFEKISELQKHICSTANSPSTYIKNITPALEILYKDEENISEYIDELTSSFVIREGTYREMIKLYEKMLDKI